MEEHETLLNLTTNGDDISTPCVNSMDHSTDVLYDMNGITDKDDYNRTLDEHILERYSLELDLKYTADELCSVYLENRSCIFRSGRRTR